MPLWVDVVRRICWNVETQHWAAKHPAPHPPKGPPCLKPMLVDCLFEGWECPCCDLHELLGARGRNSSLPGTGIHRSCMCVTILFVEWPCIPLRQHSAPACVRVCGLTGPGQDVVGPCVEQRALFHTCSSAGHLVKTRLT
jgi:hypothetical protein